MEDKKQSWTSNAAFITASIGSAAGLGNIWRFPYVMGENGGALFLLIYLLFILLICVIPLSIELAAGKVYKKDPVSIFASINPKFKYFGFLCLLAAVLIPSFYFAAGGWIINYIWIFASNDIPADFSQYFSQMSADAFIPPLLTVLFLLFTLVFPYLGVEKGIEKANSIMMPVFGGMLILLAAYALTLPGAGEGLAFMFRPDFSKFSGRMLLAAFGQALFTLGTGIGAVIAYSSYINHKINIMKTSYTVILFDTLTAVTAGIMIFPIVFTNGNEPSCGAPLAFIAIPQIFTMLPFGGFCALIFFLLLFFAAATSGINLLETSICIMCGYFKMQRKKASLILFLVIAALSAAASLSFGVLSDFKIFGKTIFDLFDFTASNILLPVCSLISCIIFGYFAEHIAKEAFGSGRYYKIMNFMLKYILPPLILIVLFSGLRAD